MNEFKVGDIVICSTENGWYSKGTVVIVLEILEDIPSLWSIRVKPLDSPSKNGLWELSKEYKLFPAAKTPLWRLLNE